MNRALKEAWVTVVGDERSAAKALVLAKSLRRVKTSKKMLILLGPSVPEKMWVDLEVEFDGLIGLEIDILNQALDFEQHAKLYCHKMGFIEKILFISPNTIFLENWDDAFKVFEGMGEQEKESGSKTFKDVPILAISPSRKIYSLLRDSKTSKPLPQNVLFLNQRSSQMFAKHGINLDAEKDTTKEWENREMDFKFVQFIGKHPYELYMNNFSTTLSPSWGRLEKIVFEICQEIYKRLSPKASPSLEMENLAVSEKMKNEPLAIIGMSCRFPGSNNIAEFWNLLINKGDGIIPIPIDRWSTENSDPNAVKLQAGLLNCPVDEFDPKFFAMSPMEASFTDPQQRLLLEICWEALEDALINPLSISGSNTAIFTGTWTRDYKELMTEHGYRYKEFFRSYMGTSFGATAGRLAHFFGTMGSNIATESGCSSSIVAVGLACKSLRRKETNLALACGVNLLLHPYSYKDMEAFISEDGHCKAFDAKADGFGRAEGCGVLILKRLSDAVRDGDRIHALIRGYGEAQEGPSKSLGTPTIQVEALAMKLALEDAGVEPNEVQFVEAHGTGTAVGDPMEMEAIAKIYSKDRREPLYVGSVKTNVGHTESCSGITGIIKTVLALKNEIIPPHRSLEELNPKIDLHKIPALIPLESVPWKRSNGHKRMAGVSSFGITGTDAHVILEEAPILEKIWSKAKAKAPLSILTLSAKSEVALNELIQAYKVHLQKSLAGQLKDVSFTAGTGRAHFNNFRTAILGKDCAEVIKKIGNNSYKKEQCVQGAIPPKIGFLFTGQGSQYHRMGKTLYETCPVFRKHFEACDEILINQHGIHIRNVLWGDKESDLLHQSLYSQTSIFCIEYCLTKLWESWGIKPDCVLGHSLGEFAAACAAGIMTLKDTLNLVAVRSKLINNLPPGQMLVVKANQKQTKHLMEQLSGKNKDFFLDFAAMNSSDQTVLAGREISIQQFKSFCESKQIKTHILNATHAFHSREMDPILSSYREVADGLNYGKAKCEFISGMEGKLVSSQIDSDYWVRHTRESVNFLQASKVICDQAAQSCGIFIEIGPQPILSAFIQQNLGTENVNLDLKVRCFPSLRKRQDEWETILNSLANLYTIGLEIDWNGFYKYIPAQKVSLPFYQFQRKKYWFEMPLERKLERGNCGKELHPLLGASISNATSNKIFQSYLDIKREVYLKDHSLGKHLIFPGAGYLEMCLAAGHASTLAGFEDFHLPYQPIVLQNLRIEAPLGINEEELIKMQTVLTFGLDLDNNNDSGSGSAWNKISIYRQQGERSGAKKWIRHATADFSSILMNSNCLNLTHLADFPTLRSQFEVEIEISDFYEKLSKVGLNFGPTFRSIKKMWRTLKKTLQNESLFQIEVPLETGEGGNGSSYLCHPVGIDGMIQALMAKDGKPDQLYTLLVPVFIQNFVWLGKSNKKINFVHISEKVSSELELDIESKSEVIIMTAVLYDEDGLKLAIMQGVTLIPTTLESISSALESQKVVLPQIMEDVWQSESNSKYKRLDLSNAFLNPEVIAHMIQTVESHEPLEEDEIEDQKIVDETVTLHVLKTLQELGWNPQTGDRIEIEEMMKNLGIISSNKLLTLRLFDILCEDGFLKLIEDSETEFEVLKAFPSLTEIGNRSQIIIQSIKGMLIEIESLIAVISKLGGVLQGKESVISILFGEDETETGAEKIYTKSKVAIRVNDMLEKTVEYLIQNWMKKDGTKLLRILEVGAGTGSGTRKILPLLKKYNINYSYTFTDLSAMFFSRAESTFSEYKENIKYKVLDIEQDPKIQGFAPNQFDLVIAINVIHATKSLTESLKNVRDLMRNRGLILILEHFKPQRMIDGSFGLFEGYWRFEDFDVRPRHALVDEGKWMDLLGKSGFDQNVTLKVTEQVAGIVLSEASDKIENYFYNSKLKEKKWIIFSPEESHISETFKSLLISSGRSVIQVKSGLEYKEGLRSSTSDRIIYIRADSKDDLGRLIQKETSSSSGIVEGILYLWGISNSDLNVIAQGYLYLIQSLGTINFQKNESLKLILVTEGTINVGDQSPGKYPFAGALWGMSKSFKSEYPNIECRLIDIDPDDSNSKVQDVFAELWKDDYDYLVAYRSGIRHVCKLTSPNMKLNPLTLPNSGRFNLILPSSKAISDLRFGTMNSLNKLEANQIEVRVKAAALNFKDVLNVLKPDSQFDKSNSVGADFAGIVTAIGSNVKSRKIGDAVIGCNFENNKALPSHLNTFEDAVVPLPERMTFAEGATLPAVFATAYHCLVDVAKLQKEETILIHTASGGVGLAAIQIARDIGARIITTAGSRKKRTYLKSLGLEYVFHSRDLSFASEINTATNGGGVQVVLNSLTSPGFKEASLKICSKNARFIEMSKLNIWTEKDIKSLRPDVDYTIIDLTAVSLDKWKWLFNRLDKFLNEGKIEPIPYVRFDSVEIREALSYLQKAKHIGKVVCILPELIMKNGEFEAKHELFNDRSTYLITGGLGGIGLEAAKWMAGAGAKYIILCGRNKPNGKAEGVIEDLNKMGKIVNAVQVDVGRLKDCQNLLKNIIVPSKGLPPLRGIMHAAGSLSDGLYVNQTWDKYESAFNGKVRGAWNLHELTKKDYLLEHFVMYSSIASVFGAMGQSNHAAGNSFLDALVHHRATLGLPGTSINWGQWGQVGIAAEIEISAIIPFTPLQAFTALELVLKSHKPQVIVFDSEFGKIKIIYTWIQRGYASGIITEGYNHGLGKGSALDSNRLEISCEMFWTEMDSVSELKQKEEILSKTIKIILIAILKLDENEEIDLHQNFQDLGLDSLMMVELKNILQGILGSKVTLTASAVADANNVYLLTQKLCELIFGKEIEINDSIAQEERLNNIIQEQTLLPVNIKPSGELTQLKDIHKILLIETNSQFAAYILESLCKRTQIEIVYCILTSNPNSKEIGNDKEKEFLDSLKNKGLLETMDLNKVKLLNGNLKEMEFGLESQLYKTLGKECDAVINCSSLQKKVKKETLENEIEQIKEEATITKNILEFICGTKFTKTKYLLHVSNLFPSGKGGKSETTEEQMLSESWPEPEDISDYLKMGYSGSRFISDRLFSQSVERGLSIKVLRLPYLGGDTRSGHFEMDENHIFLRFFSYMKLGMIPNVPLPFTVLPVDFCASIALQILLEVPKAPSAIYNLTNPHNYSFKDFFEISEEFGHPLRVVELDEFINQVDKDGVKNSILEAVRGVYGDPLNSNEVGYQGLVENSKKEILRSKRIVQVIPNYVGMAETPLETLKRDLNTANKAGWFKKYGI